jgi:hypothetical protein
MASSGQVTPRYRPGVKDGQLHRYTVTLERSIFRLRGKDDGKDSYKPYYVYVFAVCVCDKCLW